MPGAFQENTQDRVRAKCLAKELSEPSGESYTEAFECCGYLIILNGSAVIVSRSVFVVMLITDTGKLGKKSLNFP